MNTNEATTKSDGLAREFQRLLEVTRQMTTDLGPEIDSILKEGADNPLPPAEAERVLTRVIELLRDGASRRGDEHTSAALQDLDEVVRLATAARDRARGDRPARMAKTKTVHLIALHDGVEAGLVIPTPGYHEKEIPMNCGFIRTEDLGLWQKNERIELHVQQFEAKYGRDPTPHELFQIMAGQMPLEGVETGDMFSVLDLARSVASNGVRQAPIIDVDGTLLDGNRRVAACMLILMDASGEFTTRDKQRVEHIFVRQLTEHATEDDRRRIIVSLNFESDFKEQWPEYIKARRVFEEWEAMILLEQPAPGPKRQSTMKKQLSRRYALGPDASHVNRYLKMVGWANEFEEHQINARRRDEFEAKHKASKYFQYFDELGKGKNVGGVAWALNQDDTFKETVFDLLFDGKFENWRQIRALKKVFGTPEARTVLTRAHEETDNVAARGLVEDAITIANAKAADQRSLGANTRIESFAKFLEEVPPITLRQAVSTENLLRLLAALKLIEGVVAQVLKERHAENAENEGGTGDAGAAV